MHLMNSHLTSEILDIRLMIQIDKGCQAATVRLTLTLLIIGIPTG